MPVNRARGLSLSVTMGGEEGLPQAGRSHTPAGEFGQGNAANPKLIIIVIVVMAIVPVAPVVMMPGPGVPTMAVVIVAMMMMVIG